MKEMLEKSSSQMFYRAKPYLLVIMMQFGHSGMAILAKSSLNKGMSHFTFSVYRNLVATVVFAPFAIFLERKIRPTMTLSIFWKIMLLALLEPVIDQNLYYAGMKYTSATFSTSMTNILPAITFLMAWAFRLEKVNIRKFHSLAKILGTLVTVSGAMIMTLIKGPTIGLPWTKEKIYYQHLQSITSATNPQDPIKGALMIIAGCSCWGSFFILQAFTLRSYPAALSLTSLICMVGTLLDAALTLIVERGNTDIWALHWDTKLVSAIYGGLISSGFAYYISGVVMKQKGPVFVTAFNPLGMVIVAILSTFILSEQLLFGRVLGAAVIVIGLYLVIWGKSKDQNNSSKSNSDQIAPIDQAESTKNNAIMENSDPELANVSKVKPTDEAV